MDAASDSSSVVPSIDEHLSRFAREIVRRGLSIPAIALETPVSLKGSYAQIESRGPKK